MRAVGAGAVAAADLRAGRRQVLRVLHHGDQFGVVAAQRPVELAGLLIGVALIAGLELGDDADAEPFHLATTPSARLLSVW